MFRPTYPSSAYGARDGTRAERVNLVSLRANKTALERLTKFTPILLIQLYFVLLRSGFDAFPGGVAFRVGHPFHLLKSGDCVAHVSSVMNGFLTFLGESKVCIGDMVAASISDLRHNSP